MLAYIGRRVLLAVFTVWAISVLSFAIIQLPPGDYVTSYIAQMAFDGQRRHRRGGGGTFASSTVWASRSTCST